MIKENVTYNGKNYKRVAKKTAYNNFKNNKTILVLPVNVRFDNMWVQPTAISKSSIDETFDSFINSYSYYNCDNELGEYPKYYIEIEKTDNLDVIMQTLQETGVVALSNINNISQTKIKLEEKGYITEISKFTDFLLLKEIIVK